MADAVSTHVAAVTATAEEQKLLLAALTHELKTPMTSIIGYSETLQRTKLTKAQREEAVSYLHAEVRAAGTPDAEDDAADYAFGRGRDYADAFAGAGAL